MKSSIHNRWLHALISLGAALGAATWCSSPAFGQSYPTRVVRVIVPWPAGGVVDVATRIVTEQLAVSLSQPVIIENKPGANGIIGTAAAATSPPDGYTLVITSAETHAINPHVYAKLPYDPMADFAAITPFIRIPHLLVGRIGLPASSGGEAIALIQAQPGKLTYASWGIGSVPQIGMEMLVGKANLNILHVPFNGGPPAFNAVMAGQIDFMVMPTPVAEPLRKGGKIKVFGITSSARSSLMEDMPTLKEQGYDVDITNTFGFAAPAKTPAAVLEKLHVEITQIIKRPEVRSRLNGLSAEPFVLSQQEYTAYLRSELARWGEVIRRADIKIEK